MIDLCTAFDVVAVLRFIEQRFLKLLPEIYSALARFLP